MGRLGNIQALRGIAAIMVVLFHIGGAVREQAPAPTVNLLSVVGYFGANGVNLFFVISGFIMVYISRQGPIEPDRWVPFLVRRWMRIFPPYWAAYFFAALVFTYFYGAAVCYRIGLAPVSEFFLLPNAVKHCYIPQGWTLNYEVYFYAMFSIIFLMSAGIRLGLYIVAVLFGSLALVIWGRDGILYDFGAVNLHFLLGCAVGLVPAHWLSRHWRGLGSLGVLAWIAAAVVAAHYPPAGSDLGLRLLGFGFGSALLVAAAIGAEGKITVPKRVLLLGDASYSIYLTHLAALLPIRIWTNGTSQQLASHTVWIVGSIITTVGFGILFYWYVEKPLIAFSHSFLGPRAIPARAPVATD